jgi:EAL domain-containing protein (putative c-di-GMP-specific phosphodiesterase class I)
MYKAKKAGSNQYCFYAPAMNARSREILLLEAELRRAIELDEFSLFYQPQLDLQKGSIIGLEALIRWHHSARGLVSPADFVGLLETSGLIIPVGEWIIRQACRQHSILREQGFNDMRISVNVSALQFGDRDFLAKVRRILQEEDMPADRLELEITENIIMQDPEATVMTLKALRKLGVRSAIDDFGTGYSSLSYLQKFPINLLKIDQTFIRGLQAERGESAIVEASIALAQKLNLEIVAEGVETESQLNFLRACHCDIAQGYYVGKPMPAERVAAWLDNS